MKRIRVIGFFLACGGVAAILLTASQDASSAYDAARMSNLFTFVKTVQVTPDATFQTGSFPRINYVPGTNRLAVTFGAKTKNGSGTCIGAGYGYKEYNIELEPEGQSDFFLWVPEACDANDSGSLMLGNEYYFVWVPADEPGFYGWKILKYDAISCKPWIKS